MCPLHCLIWDKRSSGTAGLRWAPLQNRMWDPVFLSSTSALFAVPQGLPSTKSDSLSGFTYKSPYVGSSQFVYQILAIGILPVHRVICPSTALSLSLDIRSLLTGNPVSSATSLLIRFT